MIVFSVGDSSQIVRRDADAAVVTPNRLWMISSGRPGFQIFHADLPQHQFESMGRIINWCLVRTGLFREVRTFRCGLLAGFGMKRAGLIGEEMSGRR